MSSPIDILQATANTHQCHNAFFRQQQLKSVHDAFRVNSSAVIGAIKADTNVSNAEATTEFALALSIVRIHYTSINEPQERENENKIGNGQNAEDRREPWGVVYIEPDLRHTPFFSVVVALSAALAAGNTVALKIENTLRELPSLLRTILSQAVSTDVLAILASGTSLESLDSCIPVFQDSLFPIPKFTQLNPSRGHVVAIVDRTADLDTAAKHLVTARFAFGGSSPYAPDLVLVNEFVIKEFTEMVLQQSIRFLATASVAPEGNRQGDHLAMEPEKNWKIRVITRGDSGAIVELTNRSQKHVPLPAKQAKPVFGMSTITSLDHAIDLLTGTSITPLLAVYHFATPAHTNYLSRFITSEITFANHVPMRLLLGPPAPMLQPFDLEMRYVTKHFTRPMPAFYSLDSGSFDPERMASKLLNEAIEEIKEKKRQEWMSHGFFEQGIMIGVGLYGIPLLACVGATLFYSVRAGVQYFPFIRY